MTELSARLIFIADPGHGWLKVPLVEIVTLGIQEQISPYSFIEGRYAFLEEDCDWSRYLAARASQGYPRPVIEEQLVEHFRRPLLRFQDPSLDKEFWHRQWR